MNHYLGVSEVSEALGMSGKSGSLRFSDLSGVSGMRNRDPHRENVENILAISLPIMTMQHINESPSVSHAMTKSAWNASQRSQWAWGMLPTPTPNFFQEVHNHH